MNWRIIGRYAAALFVGETVVGFLEDFLFPSSVAVLFGGAAASFVVCGAIFTHLGAHQPERPLLHAWAALLVQVAVASVLAQILARWMSWIGRSPVPLIIFELAVLVCALVTGMLLGANLRQARRSADA